MSDEPRYGQRGPVPPARDGVGGTTGPAYGAGGAAGAGQGGTTDPGYGSGAPAGPWSSGGAPGAGQGGAGIPGHVGSNSPLGGGTGAPARRPVRWSPSPIFLALVAAAVLSGWALFNDVADRGILTFVFVATSWVVTLCLHEFAHAFVAFRNGDVSVVHRGYLTLNPLKYTHVLLSVVIPLFFLLVGGIGLPGGAVFIDRSALRTRFAHSAVSAAGPLTNVVVAVLLATAIFIGADTNPFWAALAFLMFLQVTASILNLLPIPGLDGYGVLEPYLPRSWADQAARIAPFVFFGLIALLWIPAINRAFFGAIFGIIQLLGVAPILVQTGQGLFRFWM